MDGSDRDNNAANANNDSMASLLVGGAADVSRSAVSMRGGGGTPLGKVSRQDSDLAENFHGKASIEARGGGDEQQPAPRTKSHASLIRAEASGTPRRGGGSKGGDGSPSAAIAPASGSSLHTGGQSSRRDRDRGSARPDTSGKPGVSPASQRQHASQEKRKSDVPQDMHSSKSGTESKIDKIVCTRYKLGRVLGKGSFGVIHSAMDIHTNEMVAVKIESKSVKVPQLMYEARVYRQFAGLAGFPKLRGTGEDETSRMLVIDLLGSSLEDLFDVCDRRFSIKTVLMLADQLLARVQTMHQKGVVHRDMKPDNFLMGSGKTSQMVYLIDFGLSKIYMDPNTGKHFAQRERRINDLVGTARYCSIRSHLGLQLSRRDDLESLCHVLIYLAVPGLPWQGLQANSTKEKYDKIGKLKQSLSAPEICEGLPACFEKFLEYSRNLDFEEEPDYDMCRMMFRECYQHYHYPDDDMFDWTEKLGQGLLTIGVLGARNLVGKAGRGLSNPYCTVWVTMTNNRQMKEKTQVIEGNLSPVWDSLFEFPVKDTSAVLSIYVWSKAVGFLFRDRFLGRVIIPLDKLTEKTLIEEWHPLEKRTHKSTVGGEIHLRIFYRKGHNRVKAPQ